MQKNDSIKSSTVSDETEITIGENEEFITIYENMANNALQIAKKAIELCKEIKENSYSPDEVEELIELCEELQTENEQYRQQNSQRETQIQTLLSEKQKLSEQVRELILLIQEIQSINQDLKEEIAINQTSDSKSS